MIYFLILTAFLKKVRGFDVPVRVRDVSVRVRDVSVRVRDVSVRGFDVSVRVRDVSVRVRGQKSLNHAGLRLSYYVIYAIIDMLIIIIAVTFR